MASIPLPTELLELARAFRGAGFVLYGVGGMVRNPLLGLPVSDMDVTSAMRPDDVIALADGLGLRTLDIGKRFGMVALCIGPLRFEHTTFRADSYPPGGGHRPSSVAFSDTLEEDAFRRDFTVNALYVNILSGEILDPTGGLEDLKKRLLRATSPDPAIIMGSDALRIFRMARFSAELGFSVCPGTMAAARAHAGGLADISAERIRSELDKLLLSDARYGLSSAVLRGLTALDDAGAIDVILPELAAGRNVAQRAEYHAYDVLHHMLHAADSIEPDLALRLAALLHDVGKPPAKAATGRMYAHDAMGADIAREILTRLKYPAATTNDVCALIRLHMYDLKGEAKEDTLRAFFAQNGYDRSRRLASLRRADVLGSGIEKGPVATADRWEGILEAMRAEGAPFEESELDITGADIMAATGLPASPEIGALKRRLLLHCARHPRDNQRQKLLKILRDLVNNS